MAGPPLRSCSIAAHSAILRVHRRRNLRHCRRPQNHPGSDEIGRPSCTPLRRLLRRCYQRLSPGKPRDAILHRQLVLLAMQRVLNDETYCEYEGYLISSVVEKTQS